MIIRNEISNSSSKPWTRLFAFHFALMLLGKSKNPPVLSPAMGK